MSQHIGFMGTVTHQKQEYGRNVLDRVDFRG